MDEPDDRSVTFCAECGGALSALSPMGLCAKCLVKFGMGRPEQDGDERSGTTETVGTEIDRYKLLEQIGEGGFGVVYMAEQREPVRRMVALKIIKLGMDTKQVIARFESERQALALMEHPNIARVLDAGATLAGRPYFVMELVHGVPITEFCEQNQISKRDCLGIFVDICAAVQHAHQKGIIHRDLKPSNVLVTLDDDRPLPKIIDFGIAKATAHKLTDATLFTQYHQFVGTPAYMSPEQAQMNNKDVDTRSDIYALGVLLYELLTGETPFDPNRLRIEGQEAVFRIIREEEPQKPSTRLTERRKRISYPARSDLMSVIEPDLDWVVMKALEKDRTRRYDTANALAQDVRHFLAGEPVSAVPPSFFYRLGKFVRRHRAATIGGIAVAASLILGLGFSLWSFGRERSARKVSDEQRVEAETARFAAEKARSAEAYQRARAEVAMESKRRVLYASDMQVAQNALALGDTSLALKKLTDHLPGPDEEDLRGWEWRYHYGQLHQYISLTHRYSSFDALAVSPTGHLVTSGYRKIENRPIEVFDQADFTQSRLLRHTNQFVRAFAFSQDGRAVDIEQGGRVTRVDLDTNEDQVFQRQGAYPLKLTPNGQYLVGFYRVADDPRTSMHVRSFEPDSDVPLAETTVPYLLPDRFELPRECRVSPDGQWVTLPCTDHPVRLLSIPNLEERILPVKDPVSVVAWSPDARLLATGYSSPYTIDLWDIGSGEHVRRFEGSQMSPCYDLCFSPDGTKLSFVENSGFVHVLETSGNRSRVARGAAARSKLAFSSDGTTVFTGGKDGKLLSWDATFSTPTDLAATDAELWNIEYSRDGSLLATSAADGVVRLYDAGTEAFIKALGESRGDRRPQLGVRDSRVRFSHDSRTLIADNNDNTVAVYDILTGAHRFDLTHAGQVINDLSISPDGQWIATSGDREVNFWHARSGEKAFALPTARLRHTNRWDRVTGQSVQFSPDPDSGIVVFGRYMGVNFWQVTPEAMQTGQLKRIGGAALGGGRSLSFSGDGKWLACGLVDGVALFDMASRELVSTIKGSKNTVLNVTFTSDTKTLAIPARGGNLQLWNRKAQAEVGRLLERGDRILSAKFSPNGRRLIVSTLERGIIAFEAPSMEQIDAWRQEEATTKAALPELFEEWKSSIQQERVERFANDPGAIKEWLILDPIPFDHEIDALGRAFIPGEATLNPREGTAVSIDGIPYAWRAIQQDDHYLNLAELAEGKRQRVVYAVAYLMCERDVSHLRILTGNGRAKIYLNGTEVYRNDRGWIQPDWDEVTGISLKAGLNTIVFKMAGGIDDSSVRFTDAEGKAVDGLTVTLDPQQQ